MNPWGIHTIADIYDPSCQAGLPDGRWVVAVAEPYTGNRLTAAWWVLTGRAYAFRWPRPGDLEAIWWRPSSAPTPTRGREMSVTEAEIKAGNKAMCDTFSRFGLSIDWGLKEACVKSVLEAAERVRASPPPQPEAER